jgi:hypothetical protein
MTRWALTVAAATFAMTSAGCNEQRKQECDRFVTAMKPLEQGTPTVEVVQSVSKQIEGLKLQDTALQVYAKNYVETLTVLAKTLEVKASPSAPDGTDDVIKQNLKKARTDASDVQRYCAQ